MRREIGNNFTQVCVCVCALVVVGGGVQEKCMLNVTCKIFRGHFKRPCVGFTDKITKVTGDF